MTDQNRSLVPTPDLGPQLESAVWSVLCEPIEPSAVERVKARALTIPEGSHQQSRREGSTPKRRRHLVAFAALAAGILLVLGAALLPTSPSTAFAQAIEQLKSAGAFRYTDLIYSDLENDPIEAQVMVADDGRERRDVSGIVSLFDSDGQLRLTLIERTKTAIVTQPMDVPHMPAQYQLSWLEQLKSHGTKPDKELGTKTLDGRTVEGFVANEEGHEFTIWVDAKANDLVQIESDVLIDPMERVVMKGFQFNQTFDESLFSFEVPSGYKVLPTFSK